MSNKIYESGRYKYVEDLVKKCFENVDQIREFVDDYWYMEWLYNFTEKYPCFADNRWNYETVRTISDEDYEKVNALPWFFKGIRLYFDRNRFPINHDASDDWWYAVKYKDVYFKVGICVGQVPYSYVERCEEMTNNYIDFEKIVSNESDSKYAKRRGRMLQLERLLLEMRNLNISREEVIELVNKTFK